MKSKFLLVLSLLICTSNLLGNGRGYSIGNYYYYNDDSGYSATANTIGSFTYVRDNQGGSSTINHVGNYDYVYDYSNNFHIYEPTDYSCGSYTY